MIPVPRVKAQPQLWHVSADPPPWLWFPSSSGLCRVAASPPVLISSRPPPVILSVCGWQMSRDPFAPVMRAAEPASVSQFSLPSAQWDLSRRPHMLVFQPCGGVELLRAFPQVYRTLPQHRHKSWVEKHVPDYKFYLNNTLALESSWMREDQGVFQHPEKQRLRTDPTVRMCGPAAFRKLQPLLQTPPHSSGCPVAIKPGSSKGVAPAAAGMMVMEGPCVTSSHPLHLHLSLSDVRLPLLTAPHTGTHRTWRCFLRPVLSPHIATLTSLSAPEVTLLTGNWREQNASDKISASHTDACSNPQSTAEDEAFKPSVDEGNSPRDKRPVASSPIPGSPWCVVWTGDDRVFFFNPTMHLSVWEQPVDLKDRGDLKRIIEDPPHKRKKDSLDEDSDDDDDDEDCTSKPKRNKLEHNVQREASVGSRSEQMPLERRMAHFRDMLLERGVSAFSSWEKELHKIVFDPRYLLLSPEDRKQSFEHFVKERMKEEYREKKCKLQQAKEEYRKLLEEKITSRSTFKEFSEKHGKDPRFRRVLKRRDQELFFTQFISTLKKRDKENRLRPRKMR